MRIDSSISLLLTKFEKDRTIDLPDSKIGPQFGFVFLLPFVDCPIA